MISFKVQIGFWEKWDGDGEPSGPVAWEDEPESYPTNEAARDALIALCEAQDIEPDLCRVVLAVTL